MRLCARTRSSERVSACTHVQTRASARGNELPPSPPLFSSALSGQLSASLHVHSDEFKKAILLLLPPSSSLVLLPPSGNALDATSTPSPSRVLLGNESPRARPRAIPPVPPSSRIHLRVPVHSPSSPPQCVHTSRNVTADASLPERIRQRRVSFVKRERERERNDEATSISR